MSSPPLGRLVGRRRSTSVAAAFIGLFAVHAAKAESLADPKPVSGWIVTLRGNVGMTADYEGSKGLSLYTMSGLGMRRPNSPVSYVAPDESPGLALYDNGFFKAGVTGRLRSARSSGTYSELRGIHDIDWTIEAGGFAEFWTLGKLRARAELRHGFLGHHGNTVDIYLDWVENFGRWQFAVGPRFSFADQPYMNKFFGVDRSESLVNGKAFEYHPGGGGKSVGLTANVSYQFNETWSISAFAKYVHLIGPAAQSSIPQRLGSANQLTYGLSVGYSFHLDAF
jgi:outer membrane protein